MIVSALEAQYTIEEMSFSVGADISSNYIGRGTEFGKGPAFQPADKKDSRNKRGITHQGVDFFS
jgi:hypothetical protein